MSINVYHVGDIANLTAVFEDEDGVAADPTTISLYVKDPSGNTDTYTYSGGTVTKDSVGNYSKEVTVDESGDWHYEWVATGTAAGGEPGQFMAAPSHF